jgi:hypothetical protein
MARINIMSLPIWAFLLYFKAPFAGAFFVPASDILRWRLFWTAEPTAFRGFGSADCGLWWRQLDVGDFRHGTFHDLSQTVGYSRQSISSACKRKTIEDPTLVVDLKSLVSPATRGDPMRALLWTSRSLRNLVSELAKKGHNVSPTVVGDLLRGRGYSLQANSKTRE